MADVFISYKSEDRSAAQLLSGSLKDSGFSVWFDQGLGGDVPFHEQITAELAAAVVVVALWSRQSQDSRWVYSEANEADTQRKLINARLDQTLPPKPFDRLNTHDLTAWYGDSTDHRFQGLVRDIRRITLRVDGVQPKQDAPIDLKSARAWLLIQDSLLEQDYTNFLDSHGASPQAELARLHLAQVRQYAAIDRLDTKRIHEFIISGPFISLGNLAKLERAEHHLYFSGKPSSIVSLLAVAYDQKPASPEMVEELERFIVDNEKAVAAMQGCMEIFLPKYKGVLPAKRMSHEGHKLEPAFSLATIANYMSLKFHDDLERFLRDGVVKIHKSHYPERF